MILGPLGPGPDTEHRDLAAVLSGEQREWLARMADVLPYGWVIRGMAVPRRADVVYDPRMPTGLRLIHAPTSAGAASPPTRPSPTVGVLR